MSKSIRLSKRHGVNPTICTCFFCSKEKNEIALLGHLKGDAEAPMHAVLDYEPCDECKANMDLGVTLIGAMEHPNTDGQPPMPNGAYPTGAWMVLSEQGALYIFKPKVIDDVLSAKRVCVPPEFIENLTAQSNA